MSWRMYFCKSHCHHLRLSIIYLPAPLLAAYCLVYPWLHREPSIVEVKTRQILLVNWSSIEGFRVNLGGWSDTYESTIIILEEVGQHHCQTCLQEASSRLPDTVVHKSLHMFVKYKDSKSHLLQLNSGLLSSWQMQLCHVISLSCWSCMKDIHAALIVRSWRSDEWPVAELLKGDLPHFTLLVVCCWPGLNG